MPVNFKEKKTAEDQTWRSLKAYKQDQAVMILEW